jgi:hypothetical protein
MNKTKLLNLAALLRKNAADEKGMKFDLNFVNILEDYDNYNKMGRNCGTAGCAIGLAAVSEEFPEIKPYGKTLVKYNGEVAEWNHAAADMFDLNQVEIIYLFLPSHYPPSKQKGATGERYVADRIEQFVASGGIMTPNPWYEYIDA